MTLWLYDFTWQIWWIVNVFKRCFGWIPNHLSCPFYVFLNGFITGLVKLYTRTVEHNPLKYDGWKTAEFFPIWGVVKFQGRLLNFPGGALYFKHFWLYGLLTNPNWCVFLGEFVWTLGTLKCCKDFGWEHGPKGKHCHTTNWPTSLYVFWIRESFQKDLKLVIYEFMVNFTQIACHTCDLGQGVALATCMQLVGLPFVWCARWTTDRKGQGVDGW